MSGPFGSTAWMANPASGFYDFEISNSLRFNDDDSAYLNFTPSTAGNRRTFTVSCWIKHSGVDNGASALPIVWGSTGTVSALAIAMSDNRTHSILFYNGGQNNQTTALFRDSSAWYHFVLACDTTQSTATNRTKLYVNGVAVTAWESANYPNQNTDGGINAAGESNIGNAIVFQIGGTATSNALTSENFIGFAQDTVADGQPVTINTKGAIDENQSSLTPAQQYFVQTDGTLGTSADSPSVVAGTAVTATKLIVKG